MSFDPHTTHKPEATTQAGSATLTLHDKQYEFPVISGVVMRAEVAPGSVSPEITSTDQMLMLRGRAYIFH
jgi:hypothetical protein